MHDRQLTLFVLSLLIVNLLAGCSPQDQVGQMPAVNNENCTIEKIAEIPDRALQSQFRDQCARRNTFKVSPKKEW